MPQKFTPSPPILTLLGALYPTIRWEEVAFYKGLPWYISPKMANALVLPAGYGYKEIQIYFHHWQPNSCKGLSTLVHEAFHVLQFQNLQSKGLSLLRNFLVVYIAHFIPAFFAELFQKQSFSKAREKAYFGHPMEIPAYAQDNHFQTACYAFGLSKMYGENSITNEQIQAFVAKNQHLIQTNSGVTYPKNPIWYMLSFILILHLVILKPLGDAISLLFRVGRKKEG